MHDMNKLSKTENINNTDYRYMYMTMTIQNLFVSI